MSNYIATFDPLEQFQRNLRESGKDITTAVEARRKRNRVQQLLQQFSPEDQRALAGFEDPQQLSEALLRAQSMEDAIKLRNDLFYGQENYRTNENIREDKAKKENQFDPFVLPGETMPQSYSQRKSDMNTQQYQTKSDINLNKAKSLKDYSTEKDIQKEKQVAPIRYKYQEKLKKTIPGKNTSAVQKSKSDTIDFMGSLDSDLNKLMRY